MHRIPKGESFKIVNIYNVSGEVDKAAPDQETASDDKSDRILYPNEVLTMKRALTLAFHRSLKLKISIESVKQAIAQLDQAKAAKHLTAKFEGQSLVQGPAQYLDLKPILPFDIAIRRSYSHVGRVSFQYLITTFGKVENQIAAAFVNIKAREEDYLTDRRQLIYDVKSYLYNIVKAKAYIEVSEDYLASTKDHYREAKILYKEGVVSRYDVVRSELSVSEAETSLYKAKNSEILAKSAFLALINYSEKVPYTVKTPKSKRLKKAVKLEDLQFLARKNRHEIKSIDQSIEASKAILKANRAGMNPDIILSGNYTRLTGTDFSPDEAWEVGVSIKIPILDGGETAAKTKESESSLRSLNYSREGLVRQTDLEVEQAWLNLKDAGQSLKNSLVEVKKSREGYIMARTRYTNGMSTAVEMEDSLKTLRRSKTNLVIANYDYNVALASLEKAMGVDLPDDYFAGLPENRRNEN